MHLFWVSLLLPVVPGQNFTLNTTYDSSNFFDQFNFRDAAYFNQINPDYGGDPTNGSVNYLSRRRALSSGLARITNGQVYLGVDSRNKAKLRGNSTTIHGRDSLRLESKKTWTKGIMIADIQHMPGTACGVWPSLWSYNFDENPVGEIDIIEGINVQNQNVVSLHTCGACSFTNIGGTDGRSNCNNGGTESEQCEDGENFDGCGNTMSRGSYGPTFNQGQGGVYATWLDTNSVKIYWWSRKNIPRDITAGKPDPSKWGKPASQFIGGRNCNVSRYFKGQTIIINITFCGSNIDQGAWDDQCKASTGVDTCDAYVTDHPEAFRQTNWVFNSIKLYQ
ncbi:hypothetical protein FDECE_12220 [Fusarium decemcellulare]|nr:hypothetical protein FDECE_12220 [Fusarium decemcellulare]